LFILFPHIFFVATIYTEFSKRSCAFSSDFPVLNQLIKFYHRTDLKPKAGAQNTPAFGISYADFT